jgi:hypothetical protein
VSLSRRKGRNKKTNIKFKEKVDVQWLTPAIPATQEAEIGKIKVQSQLGQKKS